MGEFNVLKDKVLTGDLLLPEQRIKYVTLAKQFLENAQKQSESELISIKKIVKELGIDPELVFNIQPETTQTTEQTSGASPTAKVVGAPAGVGKAVTGGAVDIPALKAFLIGKYPKEEGKINSLTTLEELSRPENYKNSVVEFTTPKTVKVDY
jgi:hypothetical protein